MGKNARHTGHTRNSAASPASDQIRMFGSRVEAAGRGALCIDGSVRAASLEDDGAAEQRPRPGTAARAAKPRGMRPFRPGSSTLYNEPRTSRVRHRRLLGGAFRGMPGGDDQQGEHHAGSWLHAGGSDSASRSRRQRPPTPSIELQWWHAMTGGNNEVIVKLANEFNAAQSEYKVVPSYKGSYPDTMNAGIAAFRAGNAPHIMQVFEVGTATMMAATGAVKPVHVMMKEAGEKFDSERLPVGDHRLLLDLQGRDAVVPVQLVVHRDVDQPRRVQEGRPRSRRSCRRPGRRCSRPRRS